MKKLKFILFVCVLMACSKEKDDMMVDPDTGTGGMDTTIVDSCAGIMDYNCVDREVGYIAFNKGSWWNYESSWSTRPLKVDRVDSMTVEAYRDTVACRERILWFDEIYRECNGIVSRIDSNSYTKAGFIEYVCLDDSKSVDEIWRDTIFLDNHPNDPAAHIILQFAILSRDSTGINVREHPILMDDGTLPKLRPRSTKYKYGVGIISRYTSPEVGLHRTDNLKEYDIAR